MNLRIKDPEKIVRVTAVATLVFMVCWGLVMVLFKVQPFWIDEWRLIYNLKFKTPAALWGPLDFTQQFPRVYLETLKSITSRYNYSYFILRLPSFIVNTATIFLCYHLMNKIYKTGSVTRFLFVFILVSSFTFTEYLVQIKHYPMEVFLSLTAIWQLLEILEISKSGVQNKWRYALLCCSFFAAPFFSYTYPIAVAPVFIVAFFQGILLLKSKNETRQKLTTLFLQWLPLLIALSGIVIFYIIDVSHLMGDKQMNAYWNYRRVSGASGALKLWDFFAQLGSGFVFEIIFGITGLCAFSWGIYKWIKNFGKAEYDTNELLRLYAVILILLTIGLFISGKLPVEPKFNAYTVPSVSILIIFLLDTLLRIPSSRKFTNWFTGVLIIALIGNIVSTALNPIAAPDCVLRRKIYTATESAIQKAQANNLAIIVTPGVALPDDITVNTQNLTPMSAADVLKTFPAYNADEKTQVFTISKLSDLKDCMSQLPPGITSVLAGDGLSYHVFIR